MAANRLEPAKDKESAEPSAAPAAPAAAPASAGGFKAWLPLIVTVLAMPALAYAVTSFVLLPKLQRGLNIPVESGSAAKSGGEPTAAEPAASGKKEAAGGKKESKKEVVPLNKLLVNVAGTMGARYLLTTVALAGSDGAFKEKITQHDAQLKDAASTVLSTKTIADIEKPGARNLIRGELISAFNTILGSAVVEDLYFTEFAIQ